MQGTLALRQAKNVHYSLFSHFYSSHPSQYSYLFYNFRIHFLSYLFYIPCETGKNLTLQSALEGQLMGSMRMGREKGKRSSLVQQNGTEVEPTLFG